MKRPRLFRTVLIVLAMITRAWAQENCIDRLDEIFAGCENQGCPGAAVAVMQHGKLVAEKGYGLANLEYDIPVTPRTVYHVASVSKEFTAMALVLLEQDGKLKLDDDVHHYLPELPQYGQPVTIRQLLQHTSGIRDQWQTLGLAGWRLDDVITQKQILGVLFRQKELNFPPGTKHLYSNGGYTLAAEIVARVSGTPFPEFCKQRIFDPLGMTLTHFHDDHRRIVRDRAYSYEKTANGYQNSPLNYANAGATSLFTTASDLVRWLDNFRDPKVGGRAGVERLQEQAVLADGKQIPYALGVAIGERRGLKTISHGGGDAGYRSYVLWFPEKELAIAVVSGLAAFDSGGTAYKVADALLGQRASAPEPKPAPAAAPEKTSTYVTVAPEILDRYVGHYKMEVGIETDVKRQGAKLLAEVPGANPQELKALATNRFEIQEPSGEIEFVIQPGKPAILTFTQGGNTMRGERTGSVAEPAKGLEDYAGTYWSDELETEYVVAIKNGKLTANHIRHGEIALAAAGKDRFISREWFMPEVKFVRDNSNGVTGVTLGGGRVTGIRFNRRAL